MAAAVEVFISYARADVLFVDQLKRDLRDAGATPWIDHESLPLGHPDWQEAIRRGIERATMVIYAGSPDAAQSIYVRAELEIANSKRYRIIPLWARGHKWVECAPFDLIPANYLDARGHKYSAARNQLLTSLGLPVTGATPPPQPTPNAHSYPVPVQLGALGYKGVYLNGAPCFLPPLIAIPPSPFLMGHNSANDPFAASDDTPSYWIEVDAFQIATYPVTVAEYALAVSAGAIPEPLERRGMSWALQQTRPDHPVVNVSWRHATAYTAWLNTASGQKGWRLSAEAEWEKAARWDAQRQHSRIYPWGDTFGPSRCNAIESGIATTSPVGSYPAGDATRSGASPYGVEELSGNVWEWTRSLHRPYPYISSDGREDQETAGDRVARGGSWNENLASVRATCRLRVPPTTVSDDLGFRVVFAVPGS